MPDKPLLFKKKKTSPFLGVVFMLLILIIAGLVYYIIANPINKFTLYSQYLLEKPVLFSLINKDQLFNQVLPYQTAILDHFAYYKYLTYKTNDYLQKADLDFETDLLKSFKDQAGLIVYPSNNQSVFPFIAILEKKVASAQINRILDQLTDQFKADFFVSELLYRQNNVISLKSLRYNSLIFYYTQIQDYLIISNSQDTLEKTLDLIIKNQKI